MLKDKIKSLQHEIIHLKRNNKLQALASQTKQHELKVTQTKLSKVRKKYVNELVPIIQANNSSQQLQQKITTLLSPIRSKKIIKQRKSKKDNSILSALIRY